MGKDLERLTPDRLMADHPALWRLLPEKSDPLPVVPAWPEFIRGCVGDRQSLNEQAPLAERSRKPDQE